jgi:beta-phosphoglucomutase
MIHAILFDFDGVIVHSEPLHLRALRAVVGEQGMGFTDQDYYSKYVAYSDRELIPIIARDNGRAVAPEQLAVMLDAKWDRLKQLLASEGLHAFPGTLRLIEAAGERRLPIAVCSAAMRRDIEHVLGMLGVLDRFAAIVGADDVAISKPDPAPYLLGCERLGVSPGMCVALEDTPGGIASALGAGCKVIGVAHTLPAERLHRATRVVASSSQLSLDELLKMA